jgi:hypothetical protein
VPVCKNSLHRKDTSMFLCGVKDGPCGVEATEERFFEVAKYRFVCIIRKAFFRV